MAVQSLCGCSFMLFSYFSLIDSPADRLTLAFIVFLLAWIKSKVFVSKLLVNVKKCILLTDIKPRISILVLASEILFWSGYNHTYLNNFSKITCIHQQLLLNHPCTCLCPSAAGNRKSALAKGTCWEWLQQQRHASLYRQSDDSPQSYRPGGLHSGQLLSDPSSESCIH